jgi:hypothetical protein
MRWFVKRAMACAVSAFVAVSGATFAGAQSAPVDPITRIKQVLPADVAARVIALIDRTRSRDLPAAALENRALKFAARGVDPRGIEQALSDEAQRMERVRDTLLKARGRKPDGDEIEAGAEAVRKGVDGAAVAALARGAPSGRSLAVPLYVIGSLLDRGVTADSAVRRVADRLNARVSDRDLETLPNDVAAQSGPRNGNKPAETGRELAETKRPGNAAGAGNGNSAGGPPAGVPGNAGSKGRPVTPPKKPAIPEGKKP